MKVELTAYWGPGEGPRGDDAVAAFTATWDMLDRVAGPTTWYQEGQRPVTPVTQTDVPALLAAGVNRDDGEGLAIESLGRRIALYDPDGSALRAATDGSSKVWVGHAFILREGLPTSSDEAWPVLAEHIQRWGPRTATWSSRALSKVGRRRGLKATQPRLGLLTWVRDDVESPFVGGETTRVHGGTLYRFGDTLEDVTEATADRVLPQQ